MGTGRTFNKKPVSRPKKSLRERKRRVETHKQRLVALGHDADALIHMTPGELRLSLRVSEKAAAKLAASA